MYSITFFFFFFCIFLLSYIIFCNKNLKISFFFIPTNWQYTIETFYQTIYSIIKENLNLNGEIYFPFISLISIFIFLHNLSGLLPYSFTVTSHIVVTFILSFSLFFGVNLISLKHHKIKILSIFIPTNTSFFLAIILVPIEFISYVAKPISLSVRLFINIMAGHTLLKVIVGFSWSTLLLEKLLSLISFIPLILLIILISLELGVAFIQTYVFIVLICIYLNDSINLH